MSIPVVDAADLVSVDPAVQEAVAKAIQTAFGTFGLIYISNHGLERSGVLQTFGDFLEVLERPEEEKRTWGGAEIWFQRGWTPPNTERAVVSGGQPDFKECFFASATKVDPRCKAWWPEVYADNVWPDGAERFREGLLFSGAALHGVGLALLGGCERALDLAPGTLTGRCEGAAHVTRLLKYLPLHANQVGTGILWGEEHTDFNLLTLLPGGAFFKDGVQDQPEDGGGLFLRMRPSAEHPQGARVPGRPPPGCMVAQVGQQLEVLTAGRLLATPHVITAPAEPGWTRTSMAHFIHLHGLTPVVPLQEFEGEEGASAYCPPVLAGTYAHKTLVDIGLAPAESLSRLGYRHHDRLSSFRVDEE